MRVLHSIFIILFISHSVFSSITLVYTSQGFDWGEIPDEMTFKLEAEGVYPYMSEIITIEFGNTTPALPENVSDWRLIPKYPVSVQFSNGSEWQDFSLLPALTYFVLPIGNWTLMTHLAEFEFQEFNESEVDNHDMEFWDIYYELEMNDSSRQFTATSSYYKANGVLHQSGVYVNPITGGNQIGSISLYYSPYVTQPRYLVFFVYLAATIIGLVMVAVWIRKME